MTVSVTQAANNQTPQNGDLAKALRALQADVASLAAQFNQLRTDYNANAGIGADTTATAVTLTSAQ